MIFVTVGTHEQQFNRLVEYIDNLKRNNLVEDEVIIQTGFSTYEPRFCKWSKLLPYQHMKKNISDAHIIITHGGPSSFLMPLQIGKIPIVVPRQKSFGEHVNDHQVEFVRQVADRYKNIIVVENIDCLKDTLIDYDEIVKTMSVDMKSNNAVFNEKLDEIAKRLVKR